MLCHIRVKLGKHGDINCSIARDLAQQQAVNIQQGINPNQQKRLSRQQSQITIQALYERYAQSLHARGKHSSHDEYPRVLKRHIPDWLERPADQITRDMIAERHKKITQAKGPSVANRTMTILNAVYQHAACDEIDLTNPVQALTDRKLWNPTKQRTSYIKPMQFEAWFNAAKTVPNEAIRLFLVFQLLHGLRKTEGMTLAWQHVDFDHNTFTIPKTKNGKAHTLTAGIEILIRRAVDQPRLPNGSPESRNVV